MVQTPGQRGVASPGLCLPPTVLKILRCRKILRA
jgi:hypothetical protein